MPAGLIRRGAAYSLRRRIPKDLLPAYPGRKEIVKALGTNDRNEAKRLLALAWVELDQEFAAARQRQPDDEASRIRRKLRQIAEARAAAATPAQAPTQEEIDAILAKMAVDSAEELRDEVLYERRELSRQKLLAVLNVENTDLLGDDDLAIRDLLIERNFAVQKAEWAAQAAQRTAATVIPAPIARATPPPVALQSSDADFAAVIDRWKLERMPTSKTAAAHAAAVRWFTEATGIQSASAVERQHVQAFKVALLSNGTSAANIKTKLSRLRTILGFAVAEGLLPSNPAIGVTAPAIKGPKPVAPWGVAELNQLLAGPVHQRGERPVRGRGEAAYWLPLLALFTGARREELGQLRGRDIALHTYTSPDGSDAAAWIMRIDYGEDGANQLKTASSQRNVPIHPSLVDLGFVRLAKGTAAGDLLFPQLRPSGDGKLTEKWGDWFREYRRQLGITDPRLKFHSFRHSFKDFCREARIAEGIQRQLMGHAASDVADQYGSGFSTHQLVAAIRTYRIPGLALPPPPA